MAQKTPRLPLQLMRYYEYKWRTDDGFKNSLLVFKTPRWYRIKKQVNTVESRQGVGFMFQRHELATWKALQAHAQHKIEPSLNHCLINQHPIQLDYSHQHINDTTLNLLLKYANSCELTAKIHALFAGEHVNVSENRPALHTELRMIKNGSHTVTHARDQLCQISNKIRAGEWFGCTGKPITDIVNIGIGGSDFGPRLGIHALNEYSAQHLNYHFISDIDPTAFKQTLRNLNPETTLFIVTSKSFTTHETIHNAHKAFHWVDHPNAWEKQFIAVTAQTSTAAQLGIQHILPLWDWVGGRYSFCSAVNLITCIALGFDVYMQILTGANAMDEHFKAAPLHENMPVMLALLGFWNINFLHKSSLLMLVYARQLERLVPFIQQLDMESNGKSIDLLQRPVPYSTGPIVWGGAGNQAQHSYYQLLLESQHPIAAEFISTQLFEKEMINTYCQNKIRNLSQKIPINHLHIDQCTPFTLGSLVALYEHKIYVQSILWNINAFDQPGVERGKRAFQPQVAYHD